MARDNKPSRRRARLVAATSVAALTLGGTVLAELPAQAVARPKGHDVSSHQKNVNWKKAKSKGARFVYVKATESTTYKNPYFTQQYNGSRRVGMIRGAYHFALPNKSSGRAQASYFVRNGGGWSPDGWTLPPALDIEYNPYSKKKCYGLSKGRMVSWIKSFSGEVKRRTGRHPVIYTNYHWWKTCTGNSRAFATNHALWLARYNVSAGALPAGWSFWTFWQYDNGGGGLPGDQNLFNGSMNQLREFARG
ncbi:lysozyme [Streptomyces kunmingensis]|uniref:Lysozyme n=1 Tax=Streptomyces kunmingensis TaxID=68225 RepID=A0ABU6CF87_9ACTN|nr:lysozyme [Streptomyces kunmingensis]MEB3962856.1 lysozyme [Streptomyces kunmingensis]